MTGLTKHYPGVQAHLDLSLEVPAGSIYGFLGQRRRQVDRHQVL
jgi:ABC-type multidrug transport system ATPase subunit